MTESITINLDNDVYRIIKTEAKKLNMTPETYLSDVVMPEMAKTFNDKEFWIQRLKEYNINRGIDV